MDREGIGFRAFRFYSNRFDSMRGKVFQISDKLPMARSFWGATEYYCSYYYYLRESIDAGALAKTARLGCVVPWQWQFWPSLLKTTAIHPFSRSVTLTHTHTFILSIRSHSIRTFFLSFNRQPNDEQQHAPEEAAVADEMPETTSFSFTRTILPDFRSDPRPSSSHPFPLWDPLSSSTLLENSVRKQLL